MSRKRKFQFAAITLLVIAVILLVPNTDWSKQTAIIGFCSLVLGTIGSIIAIFIPNSYSHKFKESDWRDNNDKSWSIIIPAKLHGLGNSPRAQTFILEENSYQEIGVSNVHDSEGNVTITALLKFDGKVNLS